MPGFSSQGVFLSYRREDTAPYVRLLQAEFKRRIPDTPVFVDLDSIEAGLDFAEVIREAVGSCAVLVALIGRQWATLADEGGRRRLDNPDDYVRFEVQTALKRKVRVIPLLVDGAKPLRQQQLPSELQQLARLNALELSYGRYEYDVDRLVRLLQRVLAAESGATPNEFRPDEDDFSQAAGEGLESVPYDRTRATRLIADAEGIIQSITTDGFRRATALVAVAEALAAIESDGAARLFADAERIAQTIPDKFSRANTLAAVAGALVVTDPDRAERIAESIPDKTSKAKALAIVAGALAVTDPDRAERIAESIPDKTSKAKALAAVAVALVATNPDRSERIAQSITGGFMDKILDLPEKSAVLASVAEAVAATDPDRAERIAQSIPDKLSKALALVRIAGKLESAEATG